MHNVGVELFATEPSVLDLLFKLLATVLRIFEQSSVDLYLIDYEKPNNATRQINGWRKIFLAN